ncbi:glycosyltransferase [Porphyrobacter sp. GA68]|uniref:glycosyltransferase n=1 Tax=Porphyrobacter sp. GA68 TaxID=2883480 RepID=UPI001D196810|nr:glycosyltransferase [Porphyrobacter sp. GA68]
MRIDYIINSMEGGGAQTPVPRIVGALEAAGAQVRVLALTRRNGLAIERLSAAGVDLVIRDGGEADHLAALKWFRQQARERGTQVLWTSLTRATLLGQIVGQQLGLPVVSWQHNAYLKPANERLLRWRAGKSALWVADSQQVAQLTLTRLKVPPDRLVTWPIFAADPSVPQAQGWAPDTPIVIGSLGRLHPNKGYDVLINAIALLKRQATTPLPQFRVIIGGTGQDEADLRAQADSAGVAEVELAGFVTDSHRFLATLHLYVQPSLREGFCVAAHEAMQAGLPVVVSAVGEMPFTVDESVGKTVPPGDIAALAAALTQMLAHPQQLSGMGKSARARVFSKFPPEAFDATASHIVSRLRVLLERRGKPLSRVSTP